MCIDEYQHVPELLDAIRAELNRDLRAGRFVLAGSTRYSTLPQAGQSLTGRVDIIDVLPLAQSEIDGAARSRSSIDFFAAPKRPTRQNSH